MPKINQSDWGINKTDQSGEGTPKIDQSGEGISKIDETGWSKDETGTGYWPVRSGPVRVRISDRPAYR